MQLLPPVAVPDDTTFDLVRLLQTMLADIDRMMLDEDCNATGQSIRWAQVNTVDRMPEGKLYKENIVDFRNATLSVGEREEPVNHRRPSSLQPR